MKTDIHEEEQSNYINNSNMLYDYICALTEDTTLVVTTNIPNIVSYFRFIFYNIKSNNFYIEMGGEFGLHHISIISNRINNLYINCSFTDKYITFSDNDNMNFKSIKFSLTNISRTLKIKNLKNDK